MKNKKLIALIASLSMLGSTLFALPASAENLKYTFDENADGWSIANSGTWVSKFEGHDGVIQVPENGTNDEGEIDGGVAGISMNVTEKLDVTAGARYKISADIYSISSEYFNFYFLTSWSADSSNIVAGGGISGPIEKNKWETHELEVTVTDDSKVLEKAKTALNLTIESNWGQHGKYYIDNISVEKISDETPTVPPTTNDVAKVGETTYTSLDTAISEADENATVTVLADCDLNNVVTKPITLKGESAENKPTVTLKAAPDTTKSIFNGTTTLENIIFSGGDTPNNAPIIVRDETTTPATETVTNETRFDRFVSWGSNLTIKNSEIKNLSFVSDTYGKFDFDNVKFTGIYRSGWIFNTSDKSTLNNVTATENNPVWGWCGFIETDNETTFTNCTIDNNNNCRAIWTGNTGTAILNGNNTLAEVTLGPTGHLTINEPVPMSVFVIDNDGTQAYNLNLGEKFSGNLNIPLSATAAVPEKVVATVANGADVSGITVENMDTEANELKVADGKLVIAAKAPKTAKFEQTGTTEVTTAKGTGEFAETSATGFKAQITNTGNAEGTVQTIQWAVTSDGTTKTTEKITPKTTITLAQNAVATIALIVNGLCDENATATVTAE